MRKRLFLFLLFLVLILGLALKLEAIKDNHFYFTVDQGRDAVYVREILKGKIFLRGPETSIQGIFTGPLWYYFTAVGYLFSGGHPVGGVWVLIFLNLAATVLLVLEIAKKVNRSTALAVGASLQVFWPFFETSLYSFNPFPIAVLAIWLVLSLIRFLEGKKKFYLWAAVPLFLAFNANLASAAALTIFYLLVGLTAAYGKKLLPSDFVKRFVFLSLGLLAVSFLLFNWNPYYRPWQTLYLSPLLFISLLLMILDFKKKIAIPALAIVFVLQVANFNQNFRDYRSKTNDPSILANQLKVIDWVYQESESQGFASYNYTDTFYDYPYQYLFWWWALPKYGYLPCEYANFPLSHKDFYVPGQAAYLNPKRGCDRIKFLIIESDTNGQENKDWIVKFRQFHTLVKETNVGKVKIEKYEVKLDSPNDFCLWWKKCE